MTVHQNEVEHFGLGKHFHRTESDLAAQRLVSAVQELLASLPARIKRPPNLGPAKGTICQEPAILTGEGHALLGALIDDEIADLSEAVNVGFTRAEITPFDRIVKQAETA